MLSFLKKATAPSLKNRRYNLVNKVTDNKVTDRHAFASKISLCSATSTMPYSYALAT